MGIKILGDGTFLVTARIVNKQEKKSFMDYKKFQDKFEHFHAKRLILPTTGAPRVDLTQNNFPLDRYIEADSYI